MNNPGLLANALYGIFRRAISSRPGQDQYRFRSEAGYDWGSAANVEQLDAKIFTVARCSLQDHPFPSPAAATARVVKRR
ncbi:MAG: hypothetical protein O6951_05990 [Actinobacteria bacterium]|nr:hypothetical protein [Actinomycetota bacterium]